MPNPIANSKSSPAAGCIILATIVLVFGGLIVHYTMKGLWMNKEIDKFTVPAPEPTPVATPSPEEIADARKKLDAIRDAALNNATERIILTADDLNTLIASQDILADFRGTAFVEKISEQGITTRVSQAFGSFRRDSFRYLNGEIDYWPALRKKTIVFQIRDLRVPDKEVPRKFIESYSSQDFFKLDPNHPAMGPVMRELERVYLEDGQVVVETLTDTGIKTEE